MTVHFELVSFDLHFDGGVLSIADPQVQAKNASWALLRHRDILFEN